MNKTKLWYINANKLFSGLSGKNRGEIASKLTEMNVKKNDFVYNAGDKAKTVYVVKEGRVKIIRYSPDGRELIIDILEQGDIFGELAMAGEKERETDAVAMEDSFICAMQRGDFEDLLGQMPGLSLSIIKWMGLRLRRVENRFENMIFNDVRTRLIALFNDLAKKYGMTVNDGIKIKLRLSHNEIASLVGATRETVTLELNNLKRSGSILMDGKYFILPQKHLS
ncbi:MAG: Crp/Fnr family transcriptional regulator [Deltaproteobacteria bacterium]|nr:Crp/Fnr family transcriptional regulator [Deltaproteobacteria bacterium]